MREREFTLKITCENAAFEDGPTTDDWYRATQHEICKILGILIGQLEYDPLLICEQMDTLQDSNGNTVGTWEFVEGRP